LQKDEGENVTSDKTLLSKTRETNDIYNLRLTYV